MIDARAGNRRQCDLARSTGPIEASGQGCVYRTRQQGQSYALRKKLDEIERELSRSQIISDPARRQLLETRKAVVAGWNALAARLEAQGEVALGGDVRYFAKHPPPVMTDRERLASELIRIAQVQRSARTPRDDQIRDPTPERTR